MFKRFPDILCFDYEKSSFLCSLYRTMLCFAGQAIYGQNGLIAVSLTIEKAFRMWYSPHIPHKGYEEERI